LSLTLVAAPLSRRSCMVSMLAPTDAAFINTVLLSCTTKDVKMEYTCSRQADTV
jgi:hypothetical protein